MFPSQERISGQIEHLIDVFVKSEAHIRPHFFLTGPSGSGKSYLTKTIAEKMQVPYFEVNAAQLTSEGISGNSISKAMRPLRSHWDKPNICFMDEFDKLVQSNGSETATHRSDVQNEVLHCLEAKNISIFTDYGKYEPIQVDNTLFIFAGSFSNQDVTTVKDLMDLNILREFAGRVPLVFSTKKITMDELRRALPRVKLFNDYMKLYPMTKKNEAVNGICKIMEQQFKLADLGIRLLNSAIHQWFMKDV